MKRKWIDLTQWNEQKMSEYSLNERIKNLPQTDGQTSHQILQARKVNKRAYLKWTDCEINVLEELVNLKKSIEEISKILERTPSSIEKKVEGFLSSAFSRGELAPNNNKKQRKTHKISTCEATRALEYWRNSLADEEKLGLNEREVLAGEEVSLEELKSGYLLPKKISRLFKQVEQERKQYASIRKKSSLKDLELKKIKVLVTPYTLRNKYMHGKAKSNAGKETSIFPLWFNAEIYRDGKLEILDELSLPWVDRRCLTPNEEKSSSNKYPIIGDVEDVDNFYTNNEELTKHENLDWSSFIDYALKLIQSLFDKEPELLERQSYQLLEQGYIISSNSTNNFANKAITKVYDHYIASEGKKIPKILKDFCSLDDRTKRPDITEEELFNLSQHHLGQAQKKHPLSYSQRLSLSYFNIKEGNNIFAIHGPPGTGKTTLILSMIVSEWVRSAIEGDYPALTITSSTNNAAIINLVEQFEVAGSSDQDARRWLPNFKNYGLFLVSKSKEEKIKSKKIPCIVKEKNYSLSELYEKEYQQKAKEYYLEQFNEFFNDSILELKDCQDHIHRKILEKQETLKQCIKYVIDFSSYQEKTKSFEEITSEIKKLKQNKISTSEEIKSLKESEARWLEIKTTKLFWLIFFKFIPSVKSILKDKIKLLLRDDQLNHYNGNNFLPESIDEWFRKKMSEKLALRKELVKQLNSLQEQRETYQKYYKTKKDIEKKVGFNVSIGSQINYQSTEKILAQLDLNIRYQLFILTIHYWECRWLIESEKIEKLKDSFEETKQFWQIHAMITPCMITSLQSGPNFFYYKNESKTYQIAKDFIDLLVIDEGGQAKPSVAAPLISIAKKVVVVGDDQQIEPIFSLSEPIDKSNAVKFGICKNGNQYETLKSKGLLCSGNPQTNHSYGNLIQLAGRKSLFHLKNNPKPGMRLLEHRRCQKEIISYSNELCYEGALNILTTKAECCFPPFGYAHIKGTVSKDGKSRCNKIEAETIISWLLENEEKIKKEFNKDSLDKCVGIITPFNAQRKILERYLKKKNLALDKVGTINTLQGSEKPMIILSPVYTAEDDVTRYFFDRSKNMLNVAVSRAKNTFLTFGDMDIFDSNKNAPSGLLAKYLFKNKENEILDVQPNYFNIEKNDIYIKSYSTLKNHQTLLKNALCEEKKEVSIVSPFIRENAIKEDKIIEKIKACKDKVKIKIYLCPTLVKNSKEDGGKDKASFYKLANKLSLAGASVYFVRNMHSKIMTVDNRFLIIGSFNWLSASRSGPNINQESSVLYHGPDVKSHIEKHMNTIINRSVLFKTTETELTL